MSFVKRQIDIKITHNANGKSKTLFLEGYRVECFLQNTGGYNAVGQAELRIYGMNLSDMDEFSAGGSRLIVSTEFDIEISAGNVGEAKSLILGGNIIASYPDFSSTPDVAFVISAIVGMRAKLAQIPDSSWKGDVDVATAIKKLALGAGFGFQDGGVHVKLSNSIVSGSAVDQMQQLAEHAMIPISLDNNIVYIWPNDGLRDDMPPIEVSPQTGLVGFPSYNPAGLHLKTEFNPSVLNGRRVDLKSTIPKANGVFVVILYSHALSTMVPDGPWFTEVDVLSESLVGKGGGFYR